MKDANKQFIFNGILLTVIYKRHKSLLYSMVKQIKKVEKVPVDPRIMAICKKIKDLRIAAGYSNYENFAWDNKLNRSHYHKVEKGHNMTFESFLKILDVHKLSLKDFFATIDM